MVVVKPKQILLGITTCNPYWPDKIREVDQLNISEISLFLTCLRKEERQKLFKLLKKTRLRNIPFVHIRTDTPPDDLDWLVKNYHTQTMNAHPSIANSRSFNYSPYKNVIFLENSGVINEETVREWAGICLDFSHLENFRRLAPEKFLHLKKLLAKYPIGCNHISAITEDIHIDENGSQIYATHRFEKLSDFDYLTAYPKRYFSPFIGLELENTLEEQLKAKNYILQILNN